LNKNLKESVYSTYPPYFITMPRTKQIKSGASVYSTMSVADLKKLLDERKIEGKSKLTKKESIVKVLETYDLNPEDKDAIQSMVNEMASVKKSKTVEVVQDQEVNVQDPEPSSEESEEKEVKKTTKPKKKTSEKAPEKAPEEEAKKPKKYTKKKVEKVQEQEKEQEKEPEKQRTETQEKDKEKEQMKQPEQKESENDLSLPKIAHINSSPESDQINSEEKAKEKEKEVNLKKSKTPKKVKIQEVPKESEKKQQEEEEKDNDPDMLKAYKVTLDILVKMRNLSEHAHQNQKFKEEWNSKLQDMNDELEMLMSNLKI
jgi:hypothetical protein